MTGPTQTPVTLISADRLIDGTGREPLARGAVAMQGERIVAVGETGDLAARFPGATRVDYPGATIMPGMVDSHVHVTFSASAVPFEDIQNDGDLTVGCAAPSTRATHCWPVSPCSTSWAAASAPRSSCATPSRRAPSPARA